ncbi:radical SAM/SPASM domain-containing protein [Actinomadura sp. KC216]|uniref:radical SAM/SPASM domain-containing protein n=1 Tax=Actinomadura sp. KC216 TaxID=2530370 RepID=UPI001051DC50|nr:radical SAM/SPASM domain-containing protein [Actinomadura sp. KC216]TDB72943.1 radical SAM/SPASM domain-containing protein [Actinomadura sp. KC216]
MTSTMESEQTRRTAPGMLWLDLTRKCQLGCAHCFNDSGSAGDHGTMTRDDWVRVLDQAAACDIRRVQLIGGEPTMHPDAAHLSECALALGLDVEVFSNLVHVPPRWWELFQRDRVSVATSYYSADPAEHKAVTGRPSHRLTRANIVRAVQLGVPLRAGIIDTGDAQRTEEARRDLEGIGVTRIQVDRVRQIGRAADGRSPETSELCGRCGDGRASIGPDGQVSPCAMSAWMSVGNVHETALADIVGGAAMAEATASISAATCKGGCAPDHECSPGTPGSDCTPKE